MTWVAVIDAGPPRNAPAPEFFWELSLGVYLTAREFRTHATAT